MKKPFKESDLFQPIKDFFESVGYDVQGEVNNCDVTAIKNDSLIVIELKKGLTLDLLSQAADRQRFSDLVYMAVPRPQKLNKRSSSFRRILHMFRRLELGLLFVNLDSSKSTAPDFGIEVILDPVPFDRNASIRNAKKKRSAILKEHTSRKNKSNKGGVNKTKILTHYREKAIDIAQFLKENGPTKLSKIKEECGLTLKDGSILQKNIYGWFDRISPGIYDINKIGENEVTELLHHWKFNSE